MAMTDLIIGTGNMSGKGLYAARDFKKGEVVIKYELKPITFQELQNLPPEEYAATHNVNGQIYLYPEPVRYINHSESPNVRNDHEQRADIALRDIKAGEPITVDARYDDVPLIKKVDAVLAKVPSIQEGLDFYREQLGMQTIWKKEDMAAVRLGDTELVLSTKLDPETDFLVDSAEQAVKVFENAGGKVVAPPEDIPVGKVAVVEDPFGNKLTLVDLSKGQYQTDKSGNVTGVSDDASAGGYAPVGQKMKLYRFSPIKTKEQLLEAVSYVTEQSNNLCKKITGQYLPITYLTICAHYPDEYEQLIKIAGELGEVSEANNGIAISLKEPVKTSGQTVPKLRIRKPDPYRTQVGCNDFEPGDYQEFKARYLAANPNNLRVIQRPDYEMLEFYDPDFDVFSYVVSK